MRIVGNLRCPTRSGKQAPKRKLPTYAKTPPHAQRRSGRNRQDEPYSIIIISEDRHACCSVHRGRNPTTGYGVVNLIILACLYRKLSANVPASEFPKGEQQT